MKKTLSLILASLLIASTLVGCGTAAATSGETSADASASSDTAAAADTSATEAETTTEAALDVPTDKDYAGYDYKIYGYELSRLQGEQKADELTGDLVNDAVYTRNQKAEEQFNVKIDVIINKWDNDDCRTNIQNAVLAGSDDYDLFTGNTYNMTYLSAAGNFLNLSKCQYIDESKPWWNQSIYNELSVGKHAYLLTGDICLSNYGTLEAVFFNKGYLTSYNMENPYDLVASDAWTLDKLISMTKDFYVDVDGDGKKSDDAGPDIYGFYGSSNSIYYLADEYIDITTKNADNYPEVTFSSERTQNIYDTLKTWLTSSTGVLMPEGWTDYTVFSDSALCVFTIMGVGSTSNMRDSSVDYGFVPIPKYDENQTSYHERSSGLVVAFPLTATDPDRTSMIAETLAYYGRQLVYPAYVENTIAMKGTRDEDSLKMLDIILNNVTYNYGIEYGGFQGYSYGLLEYMRSDKGFASFYESMSSAATAELTDYANQILALPD